MKSIIFSIIALAVSGLMLYASLSGRQENTFNNDLTFKKLNDLEQNYNSSFYEALYSLPELKAISIISVDKISSVYDNKWISPATALEMLNAEDKQRLVASIKEYLESMPDNDAKQDMLLKVKRWCIAHSQIELISDKMRISRESLVRSISKIAGTDSLVINFSENQNHGEAAINALDYPQVYFESINYLSALSGREQMLYFSKLFENLSHITNY